MFRKIFGFLLQSRFSPQFFCKKNLFGHVEPSRTLTLSFGELMVHADLAEGVTAEHKVARRSQSSVYARINWKLFWHCGFLIN